MSTRTGWLRRAVAVAVITGLSAGALASGASSASGVRSVRGFDGSTIKIAGMGVGSSFSGAPIGTQARFKRFNDTNEIKGLKLNYTEFADDNQDPAQATSEARRLVTQEQVFAIIPDFSAVNPGPFFAQQHVPYLGFAFDNTYCSSPKPSTTVWGFGFDGCVVSANPPYIGDQISPLYKYVSEKSGKKNPSIVIFSNDNQSGKNSTRFGASSAEGAGFKVVYAKGAVPITTSDYTPYVTAFMTADGGKQPDLINCNLSTQCLPIWNALKAAGFTGTYWTPIGIDLFAKALQGTVSTSYYNPAPNPGLTQMKADLTAVNAPANLPVFTEYAYFAADMFIQALKAIVKKSGIKGITPEAVQKVLSTQTWQIKGFVGPIKYPAATVQPTPYCATLITSTGTAPWTVVEPYQCSYKRYKILSKFVGS
jgi:ABC-type branched-subunit amino acid transport system substrate-binding protein